MPRKPIKTKWEHVSKLLFSSYCTMQCKHTSNKFLPYGNINQMCGTSENATFDMCAQRRIRKACAFAQFDQNLHWVQLDTKGCKISSYGQRRLWSYCANAQADLSLRLAHMSEGTFPLVSAQICVMISFYILLSVARGTSTQTCATAL